MDETIFASEPMRIGKTKWRVLVYVHKYYGRCTRYQYFDGWNWQNETNHPRYNPHDGTWAGLPKGLRKLYNNNEDAINKALFAPVDTGEDLPQLTFAPAPDQQLRLL